MNIVYLFLQHIPRETYNIIMRTSSTIYLALSALISNGSHAFQLSNHHRVVSSRFVSVQSATSLGSTQSSSSPSVVLDRVFEIDSRPIILFDGVCNLCNSAVNLALDWDPRGKLRFAALQSKVGKNLLQAHGRDANDISSIVFVTPKGAFTKSDAILGITQELNPLPFVPLKPLALAGQYMVPQILRDAVYD
eukprot:scaffold4918_cov90-Skeletonema_dohrnii-CCMP3373.AAC.1